ncbi:MAG: hypothetical protein ACKOC0_00945 [Cytophagales bacterium]
MKKRRIVIASVLKPVDDTRAFEKMAQTLVNQNFEVFLIGQPSQNATSTNPSIHFLQLAKIHRISFARWFTPLVVGRKIYQVKPELLIVNTHELLIVAIVYRLLFGAKILYDIQENYAQNILSTEAFPRVIRLPLAAWVKLKERCASHWFHHFLLAEKSYENELGFIGKKYSVVENKVALPRGFRRLPTPSKRKLIFTGTLAENTGVFQAIELAKKLHAIDTITELELLGFCAQRSTLQRIQSAIQGCTFITLKGGENLVPHREIFEAISTANFGIISYPIRPYLQHKMPTKLFEYLACQLPILLQNNIEWTTLLNQFGGGIVLDFNNYDPIRLLSQIRSSSFYAISKSESLHRLDWASEEDALLRVVRLYCS